MPPSTTLFDRLCRLSPTEREFDAGALLFRRGDEVSVLHLVLDGEAHLVRHRADGGRLVLQRAAPKTILAEASVFSERYHCDCVAVVPTRTHAVGRAAVRALLAEERGVRGVLGAPPLARASDHAPSGGDPLAPHGARTARRLDGVERRPPSPEGHMEYDRERNRDQPRSAVPGTRKAPHGPARPGDRRGVSDCRPRHCLNVDTP